jgi:3-isopropylmalate/(R)-2-methylmalate dehydratase small subunit
MSVNVTETGIEPIHTLTSTVAVFPMENVDTDQIIPARFLKITDMVGVGAHLFEDLCHKGDGTLDPNFPLNKEENRGAAILLAGKNFGCGSSREHAAWALVGAGFRAVVSTSFADIFKNNALKNGLLPIVVNDATWNAIARVASGRGEVTVDLEQQEIRWKGGSAQFEVDAFARTCLLHGTDELGYILRQEEKITEYEEQHLSGVHA